MSKNEGLKLNWFVEGRWWTLLLLVSCVAVATIVISDQGSLWILPLLVLLLVAWFVFILPVSGLKVSLKRAIPFLICLVFVVSVGVYLESWMQILLFVAYPWIWLVTSSIAQGTLWTWILSACMWISLTLKDPSEWAFVLGYTVVVGGFSMMMGLWISRIYNWGTEREQMRQELKRSQQQLVELTAVSAAAGEREHFAREIHDTLAQGFTSVITLSQATLPLLESGGDLAKVTERLQLIESVARDNLAEARALIKSMRPPALEESDFSQALHRLSSSLEQRTGIQVQLNLAPITFPADAELEVALLRVAQEAFNNVERHSQATQVEVDLLVDEAGLLFFKVTDDGIGRAASSQNADSDDSLENKPARGGFGLRGMHERLNLLGGIVSVTDAVPSGTVLQVQLPFNGDFVDAGNSDELGE